MSWLAQFLLITVLENEINCHSIDFLAEFKLYKRKILLLLTSFYSLILFLSLLPSPFTFGPIEIKFIGQLLNLTTGLPWMYLLFLSLLNFH